MGYADGKIFTRANWKELDRELALTSRQGQIVRCVVRGFSDKQIAADLGLSIPTVRTHLGRLFNRLELQDRVELILHVFGTYLAGCQKTSCRRLR